MQPWLVAVGDSVSILCNHRRHVHPDHDFYRLQQQPLQPSLPDPRMQSHLFRSYIQQ